MEFNWKSVVGAIAPTVATALGGPLAGAAVTTLSTALLGTPDGTEAKVAEAIRTDPDALVKLRTAELEFQARLTELDVDLERIHQADRDSARQRELSTQDSTPRVLAYLVIVGFIGIIGAVLFAPVKVTDSALLGVLIGYISAKAEQVVSYYFGSSSGSTEKNRTIERAMSRGKGL